MIQFSFFKPQNGVIGTTKPININILQYIKAIKQGTWKKPVLDVRKGIRAKKNMGAVTVSGTFSERAKNSLISHSNLICIDIDRKDNINAINANLGALKIDPYTHVLHHSVGGLGVCILVKIDGAKHLQSFLGLSNYYFDKYGIVIDASCKDVARCRIVSFDPNLVYNSGALTFAATIEPPKAEFKKYDVHSNNTAQRVEFCINMLHKYNTDITQSNDIGQSNYDRWAKVGFAIASEFGEFGRAYFHDVSRLHPKYNFTECDNKYSIILKENSRCNISTFFYLYKQCNLPFFTLQDT